ncbi:bicaudal D-like protein 2 [Elysia marginata]|uniref:Bicaudal D-like protein 2 n=1 Tax=Elysia marginata TaxID=1093978 RepID=A0AAV4ERU4_9GAST|nr:bicaudal D-like protein 2 [Elysia marginata]
MKEISNLHAEISRLQTRNAKVGDPAIEKALEELRSKCDQYERRIQDQESDLKSAQQAAGTAQSSLSDLQSELYRITEDLAQLYHLVCQVTGETPSRVMLDHAKGGSAAAAVGEGDEAGVKVKKEPQDDTSESVNAADTKPSVIANGEVRDLASHTGCDTSFGLVNTAGCGQRAKETKKFKKYREIVLCC